VTMLPPDDPRFEFIDDPMPPEPDAAVLQRVVSRGHQRLVRRRALFGGIAVAAAALVLGSGVAVAQHRSAGSSVTVQGPGDVAVDGATTTTTLPALSTTTIGSGSGSGLGDLTSTTAPGLSCFACAAHIPSDTQAATTSSYTGAVTVSPTEVTAGDYVSVEFHVYNATDHPVDVEGMLGGPATAVVCANDLTGDGHTNTPLHNDDPDANIFWIIAPVTLPGGFAGIGPINVQTSAAEVGVVTCEGVLVGQRHDGDTITNYVIARIDNIPAVTYTVLPAPADTSTTMASTAGTTTTTVPETTIPAQ